MSDTNDIVDIAPDANDPALFANASDAPYAENHASNDAAPDAVTAQPTPKQFFPIVDVAGMTMLRALMPNVLNFVEVQGMDVSGRQDYRVLVVPTGLAAPDIAPDACVEPSEPSEPSEPTEQQQ